MYMRILIFNAIKQLSNKIFHVSAKNVWSAAETQAEANRNRHLVTQGAPNTSQCCAEVGINVCRII